MVGVTHYIYAGLLQTYLARVAFKRTGNMGSIIPTLSSIAHFRAINKIKEGDGAFKPSSWHLKSDWPNIIFEVGVFERFTQL